MTGPRSAEPEAQARDLAAAITQVSEEALPEIARTLLDAEPACLFGATEFRIRDLALRIAAKAYERRLAQKSRLRHLRGDLPALRVQRRLSC